MIDPGTLKCYCFQAILAREFLLSVAENTPNSSQTRGRLARSRVGTIIGRVTKSRYTELYVVVFVALGVIVFWGSTAEGQASLLDRWARKYVEEAALTLSSPVRTSSFQMAEINSFIAGSGGDSSTVAPTPSLAAPTIQESTMLAFTPPDDDYLDRLSTQRSQISEYVVQEDDLLSFIASDFGVSIDTLVWANGLKDADSISPGQTIRIPPVSGVIHKIAKGDTATALAKKYGVEADRIVAYNRLPQDGALEVGSDLIIPDGKMPNAVPITVARKGTTTATRAAGLFGHLPNLGEYFKLPTFGFNWGRIHGRNGVDIANSCGTPIYAAADGAVTVADADGWNGGFGKYIKISHANGTETLYAHASKLFAFVGQTVGKGDKIMLMGTTGRSTGCHLHFEVHGAKNPLAK